MKKYLGVGLLLFAGFIYMGSLRAQGVINQDSLKMAHGRLMSKSSSYFSAYKSEIDSRIKKTERMAGAGAKDTSGAKSLIKLYQADSSFYQTVIYKGDSLLQKLQAHDKEVGETMQKGDQASKFLMENEEKMDKVKSVLNYAKDVAKQVDKRLKSSNGELQEMRDYNAKQEKKKQKK